MQIFKDFLADSIVKVCLHKLKYQVQIFVVLSFNYSVEFYNIFVIDLMQKDDLTISALGVCGVLKSVKYFFESKGFACFNLLNFPNVAVSSTADFFEKFVPVEDVILYIFSHVSERNNLKIEFKISYKSVMYESQFY